MTHLEEKISCEIPNFIMTNCGQPTHLTIHGQSSWEREDLSVQVIDGKFPVYRWLKAISCTHCVTCYATQ